MSTKIVVTGGAGFIGTGVVQELLRQKDAQGNAKWEVTVADDLSNPESKPPVGARFLKLDLKEPAQAYEALQGQEYVIHAAAKIGGIGYFHRKPSFIINDNSCINASVIDASVRSGIKRFVYLSSSMVYEGATEYPHDESHLTTMPMPKTAYGRSKLIGEWMCHAALQESGLEYAIAIPFNAYGPGEKPLVKEGKLEVGFSHVIPDLFYKVSQASGSSVEILGDGLQTRCFTHVNDLARGIVALVTDPKAKNEAFNLANPEETSVISLVEMIWKICGKQGEPQIVRAQPFADDVRRRVPKIDKAKLLLNFESTLSLQKGLELVWDWYRREGFTC